jgi:hypothetical protein
MPRMLWIKKLLTLQQVHQAVFSFLRGILAEWVDWKDPSTHKKPRDCKNPDLRKDLDDFPYRPEGWQKGKPFTRADFD